MCSALVIHPAPQLFLDNAVNLQVGIASDRGSEMTVIRTCQPEMPRAFHTVFCLLHAPKRHTADHCLLRRTGNFRQQLLYLLRMDFLAAHLRFRLADSLHAVAEITDNGSELLQPVRVRHIMHTVHKRQLHPVKMLCNRLVRRQHEILNDVRRRIPLIRLNVRGTPLTVEIDLTFRKIKIN